MTDKTYLYSRLSRKLLRKLQKSQYSVLFGIDIWYLDIDIDFFVAVVRLRTGPVLRYNDIPSV